MTTAEQRRIKKQHTHDRYAASITTLAQFSQEVERATGGRRDYSQEHVPGELSPQQRAA